MEFFEVLLCVSYLNFHCVVVVLCDVFLKPMGQYKELFKTTDVRWLKKNKLLLPALTLWIQHWKLAVEGLMGRMLSYRGRIYKDEECISIPGQYFVLEGFGPGKDQQGTLGGGKAAHFPSVRVSIPLLFCLGCRALSSQSR